MQDKWKKEIFFILAVVGAAAGVGNLWRFPYVAYENGGGAFLFPYFICVFALGLPLVFLEIGLGRWSKGSIAATFRKKSKKLTWIGWWALINSMVIVFYYAVVLAWSVQFVYYSIFESWGDDPVNFFISKVLNLTDSPFNLGSIQIFTLFSLLIIWGAIFSIVKSGVKRISRVLMVTVPLPLIILIILLVQSTTLPGSSTGIQQFIRPDFSKIFTFGIWAAAASQVILSLGLGMGQIIAYASKKKDDSKVVKSSIYITLLNSLFSILAGFTVFATMGYLANQQGVPLNELKLDGLFLAFVSYPTAISSLPLAPIIGVFFFSLLILLGIDSAFAGIEAVSVAYKENSPKFSKRRIALILTTIGFFGGIIYTTGSGLMWLDIVDHWVANYAIVSIVILQIIVFGNTARFSEIIKTISPKIKKGFLYGLKIWIGIIVPILLIFVFGGNFLEEFVSTYGGYHESAILIGGWGSFVLSIILAIIVSVKYNKKK